MKSILFSLTTAAMIALASPALAHEGSHPETEQKSPVEIVTAFGTALDAGDKATLTRLLAPDVQIAESGGLERSFEEYRSHHMDAETQTSLLLSILNNDLLGKIFESVPAEHYPRVRSTCASFCQLITWGKPEALASWLSRFTCLRRAVRPRPGAQADTHETRRQSNSAHVESIRKLEGGRGRSPGHSRPTVSRCLCELKCVPSDH